MKKFRVNILILIISIIIASCEKEPDLKYPVLTFKQYVKQLLIDEKWYYWVDEVKNVNPSNSISDEDYFNSLLYDSLDKWSFYTTYSKYVSYFVEGKYTGYGFLPLADKDGNVRVAFVFKNSPFGKAGIKRGYIINKINGNSASLLYAADKLNDEFAKFTSHTFEILDYQKNKITLSLSKEEITQNTVLYYDTFNVETLRIGYLVFHSFIDPAYDELKNVFSDFKQKGINNLIIDLRYNGGGSLGVAKYLGNIIAGKRAAKKIFNTTQYNNYKSEFSSSDFFEEDENSLDIQSVVAITTESTASASELLINSLKPFIDTKIAGTPSHGKPVGMRIFVYYNWVVAPITFKSLNAKGEGDYFKGLPVDGYSDDDLEHDFGDLEELSLKQAMNYFKTGTFLPQDSTLKAMSLSLNINVNPLKGFQRQIGAY
jgi:C-terminal processing protease CtpA/Prc